MKDNEHIQMVSLEEYERLSTDDRLAFLDLHAEKSTDLDEEFCQAALRWETSSLARWYLIRALGFLKSESAIPDLIQVCYEADADFGNTSLHLICAWSLGQIGEASLPPLLKALESNKTTDARKCIVDALGEIRSEKAIPALYEAFRKDDYGVKLFVALSLSKIGKPALDTLHFLLANSGEWRERLYIIDAICKIKDPSSTSVIRKVLYDGTSEEKRFVLEKYMDWFDESFRDPLKLISETEPSELSSLAKKLLTTQL